MKNAFSLLVTFLSVVVPLLPFLNIIIVFAQVASF